MASSSHLPDPWSFFLLQKSTIQESELGWCIEAAHISPSVCLFRRSTLITIPIDSSSDLCCLPDNPTEASLACFLANNQPTCLNPVPILTEQHKRCEDKCEDDFVCVRPAESENLLRITVLDPWQKRQRVVLWTGPLQEIYNDGGLLHSLTYCRRSSDSVIVSTRLPRFSFLPLSCPVWLNTLWEYVAPILVYAL